MSNKSCKDYDVSMELKNVGNIQRVSSSSKKINHVLKGLEKQEVLHQKVNLREEMSSKSCKDHGVLMEIENVGNGQRILTSSKQNNLVHREKEKQNVSYQGDLQGDKVNNTICEDHVVLMGHGIVGNDQRVLTSSKQNNYVHGGKENRHVLNQPMHQDSMELLLLRIVAVGVCAVFALLTGSSEDGGSQ